jgi:serine/threonine protein phosphatase PrpC
MPNGRTQNPPGSPPLRVEAAAATHLGRARARNEDSFASAIHLGLFLVADGIGGRPAGDIASRMAVDAVRRCIANDDPDDTWPYARQRAGEREEALLILSFRQANQALLDAARRDPRLQGMGTTLSAALIRGRRAFLAHVGDSRIYRHRDGTLERLTVDHTVVEAARRKGLDIEDLEERYGGILLRAVGTDPRLDVDTRVEIVEPGDTLLLCTDGLWEPVAEDDIADALERPGGPHAAVAALVARALDRGGPDNVTCVVVRFAEP